MLAAGFRVMQGLCKATEPVAVLKHAQQRSIPLQPSAAATAMAKHGPSKGC